MYAKYRKQGMNICYWGYAYIIGGSLTQPQNETPMAWHRFLKHISKPN